MRDGLDTIPPPGSMSQDALVAILMDVAALALRSTSRSLRG